MKKFFSIAALTLLMGAMTVSCSTDDMEEVTASINSKASVAVTNINGYNISDFTPGTDGKTWSFTVQKTTTEKGTGLSHLVVGFNYCPDFTSENEVTVLSEGMTIAYSEGKGTECDVDQFDSFFFKFDGLEEVYSNGQVHTFTFTTSEALRIDNFRVWVKAGNSCAAGEVDGLKSCEVIPSGCSLSQGYYFAKPGSTWGGNSVTIGGNTYTEAEGRAIWNTSNKLGIKDSKAGFLQASAILLSEKRGLLNLDNYSDLKSDILIIHNYLNGKVKLSPLYLPTGDMQVKAAAGRIGDWINANHCDETTSM